MHFGCGQYVISHRSLCYEQYKERGWTQYPPDFSKIWCSGTIIALHLSCRISFSGAKAAAVSLVNQVQNESSSISIWELKLLTFKDLQKVFSCIQNSSALYAMHLKYPALGFMPWNLLAAPSGLPIFQYCTDSQHLQLCDLKSETVDVDMNKHLSIFGVQVSSTI